MKVITIAIESNVNIDLSEYNILTICSIHPGNEHSGTGGFSRFTYNTVTKLLTILSSYSYYDTITIFYYIDICEDRDKKLNEILN